MTDSSVQMTHLVLDRMAHLAALFLKARIDLSNEKRSQADIEDLLRAERIVYHREKRLSPHDIPDFLIDGIAVEMKLRQSRRDIKRQLTRYAAFEEVEGLLCLSNTSLVLPSTINRKPVRFVSLGRAWL